MYHSAEVLAHEFFEQFRAGITVGYALGFQDLVGKVGTCFEGSLFGEDEGVVAIE